MSESVPMSCPICKGSLNDRATTKVFTKGRQTILKYSQLYNDSDLTNYLLNEPADPITVHIDCRRSYTSQRRYEQRKAKLTNPHPDEPHCVHPVFCSDRKKIVFFCSKPIPQDSTHPNRVQYSSV